MKRRGIQLSPRHKRWFYSISVTLFLSGAAWLLSDWVAERNETQASLFQSLKPWMLKVHGAAAMAFLVALGILIPTHIKRAWQARRNRANGFFLVTAMAVLVLTGYGLYYFGDERWRSGAHWIHVVLGLASPVLLVWHIWLGRRSNPPKCTSRN